MKKIKIIGALIFILSIILVFLFYHVTKENQSHNHLINIMTEQKNFTQEISKNIFYIYKNQDTSIAMIDNCIKDFLNVMSNKKQGLQKSKKILKLWNKFYFNVQSFRNQIKNKTLYSTILLEKLIKDIYTINLELIIESDKFIKAQEAAFYKKQKVYKIILYVLSTILVTLLLYIFTQLKTIIIFIQKFLHTSKAIISNSSIRELKPIEIENKNLEISEAKNNFNLLVKKINNSIKYSSNSINHSCESLKDVEHHIEDLVELIYTMNEGTRDKELRKKEDAIIQSLEELSSAEIKLKNLKRDLDNLISYSKLKNNN
jgi:methyl-accepting chemotaxis protein